MRSKGTGAKEDFPVLQADLQISFYYRLQSLRKVVLREALQATVASLDVARIDAELNQLVPKESLQLVAKFGIRGEVVFPLPLILRENPFLVAYYRLLFGLSQKAFYNKGPFGRFKAMEDRGELTGAGAGLLRPFCESLIATAAEFVHGVDELSLSVFNDLQLLTLGAQFRGSENTRIGDHAAKQVFRLIKSILSVQIEEETSRTLVISNAAGRRVLVEFSADPDVLITEKLPNATRTVLSIEIKGGADASNIHNRLGEAEKSHIKAKRLGCNEFWTLLRVELDTDRASAGSPTTTAFYQIDRITDATTSEHSRFREQLMSRLGI